MIAEIFSSVSIPHFQPCHMRSLVSPEKKSSIFPNLFQGWRRGTCVASLKNWKSKKELIAQRKEQKKLSFSARDAKDSSSLCLMITMIFEIFRLLFLFLFCFPLSTWLPTKNESTSPGGQIKWAKNGVTMETVCPLFYGSKQFRSNKSVPSLLPTSLHTTYLWLAHTKFRYFLLFLAHAL